MSVRKGKAIWFASASFIILGFLISSGCSVYGIKNETGNPIVENNVRKIVNGKTTASEILELFGAPTQTSSLGDNELYIYKNCKSSGSMVAVPFVGQSGTKERCNTLTVTIAKKSGMVENYNFQKMFEGD
jgi:outer membrane protein assembly factor BamE (lipoprotein component of BamABCDE complex)